MRLEYDGKEDDAGDDENTRAAYAMSKYAYFPCFKCKKAYFGGAAACEAGRGSAEFDPSELVCPLCAGGGAAQVCRAVRMYVCVCVPVCVPVCAFVRICAHLCAFVRICSHLCTFVCSCAHV